MTIGSVYVDRGASEPRALAEHMVRSARRTMPGVAVVHFTDEVTEPLSDVDTVCRRPTGSLALFTLEHYAACEGEWLFVDTDVVFQRSVAQVFDHPFAIAVATREGTLLPKEVGTKFMAANPYNKGVVFSRARDFWQAAVVHCRRLSAERQAWMGDQVSMNAIIAQGGFDVRVLPSGYNYPPHRPDENVRDKAVLHLKGHRKAWIAEYAA